MDAIFSILNRDNTISVNRPLAHAIGVQETIIYQALLAKQSYYEERDMLIEGCWFFSTVPDLQESTGLSEKRQARCIARLIELGLIETKKDGAHIKRYFRIIENVDIVKELIVKGQDKMKSIKPEAAIRYKKKRQGNSTRSAVLAEQESVNEAHHSSETAEQERSDAGICSAVSEEHAPSNCSSLHVPNGATCSAESSEYIKESKDNKSKVINQSINHTSKQQNTNKMTDKIDTSTLHSMRQVACIERHDECQERIKRNIDYDELINDKRGFKREIDNIIAIMTDVICSQSRFIHVNGEEMTHEVVEKRYLELTYDDIDYVINAIQHKANKINNIRSYLITALFNSHATRAIGEFAEACAEM